MTVFRECEAGEILVNNQCQVCPAGSYSLKYSASENTCTPCPDNTDVCYGNKLFVSAGYWRISSLSTTMLECPLGKAACPGGYYFNGVNGTVTPTMAPSATPSSQTSSSRKRHLLSLTNTVTIITGDADSLYSNIGCAKGYEGPLCSSCYVGYYFDYGNNICSACIASRGSTSLATMVTSQFYSNLLVTLFLPTWNQSYITLPVRLVYQLHSSCWRRSLFFKTKEKNSKNCEMNWKSTAKAESLIISRGNLMYQAELPLANLMFLMLEVMRRKDFEMIGFVVVLFLVHFPISYRNFVIDLPLSFLKWRFLWLHFRSFRVCHSILMWFIQHFLWNCYDQPVLLVFQHQVWVVHNVKLVSYALILIDNLS